MQYVYNVRYSIPVNILSHPVGRNVIVDKSITGTYFFEQLATLRVVPTTLLQATDPLEWSCDKIPLFTYISKRLDIHLTSRMQPTWIRKNSGTVVA